MLPEDVQAKLEMARSLQDQITSIELGEDDRLVLMRPLMVALAPYGMTSFTIRIPFPTYNDGDPCHAYVSDSITLDVCVFPSPPHEDDEADEEEDEEDDARNEESYEDKYSFESDDLASSLKDYNTDPSVPNPMPFEEVGTLWDLIYHQFEVMLLLDKMPTSCELRYFWVDGALVASEDEYYV